MKMNTITFVLFLIVIVTNTATVVEKATKVWRSDSWKVFSQDKPELYSNHDNVLHAYLAEVSAIPKELEHTGAAPFDEHLLGVQAVLRRWGAQEYLADAGLFHSIYGTEGYQGFKLPLSEREKLISLIGDKAERLVWIFCMVDRTTLDATLYMDPSAVKYELRARPELGRFPIILRGEQEWLDFIELTISDWLEQVEGAASKPNCFYNWKVGDAWGYRRLAYRKMADILMSRGTKENQERLKISLEMYNDVFDAETAATKHIHQPVTPPITDAAREAQEAVASYLKFRNGADYDEL